MSVKTKLTGRQKAAILLITLGTDVSANVLRQLRETEIEQLTLEIFATEQIPDETRSEVLGECYQIALASQYLSTGGYHYAQDMLSRALGNEKANEIISRLATTLRRQHFDFLRDSDPTQLANFISQEQPQAIALILSHLQPTLASKVIAHLAPDIQSEVAMRIATMERTPPEVIDAVESVLRQRFSNVITSDYTAAGGVEYLVKILTNVDRGTERVILDDFDKHVPELAEEVRKLMFTFDNLIQLDDYALQRVLREVDMRDLARALRGTSDELRERIFRNVSSRAADMLREDIAVSGPVRVKQVEEAQQRIVTVVRRLEESGDIIIQRGGDDAVL
ncbi:MAG: flagellar motor switch protein FliG [Chloroflexi bacterium]|nr:flagellar motor switch protein FliG [Chloroflexota bacterium]